MAEEFLEELRTANELRREANGHAKKRNVWLHAMDRSLEDIKASLDDIHDGECLLAFELIRFSELETLRYTTSGGRMEDLNSNETTLEYIFDMERRMRNVGEALRKEAALEDARKKKAEEEGKGKEGEEVGDSEENGSAKDDGSGGGKEQEGEQK